MEKVRTHSVYLIVLMKVGWEILRNPEVLTVDIMIQIALLHYAFWAYMSYERRLK